MGRFWGVNCWCSLWNVAKVIWCLLHFLENHIHTKRSRMILTGYICCYSWHVCVRKRIFVLMFVCHHVWFNCCWIILGPEISNPSEPGQHHLVIWYHEISILMWQIPLAAQGPVCSERAPWTPSRVRDFQRIGVKIQASQCIPALSSRGANEKP